MNPHIEVLTKKLYAVKFSYLPWISDIDIAIDPSIPVTEEPGRITSDGIMVLNKDHPGYLVLKNGFLVLQKKKLKGLKQMMQQTEKVINKTPKQNLYHFMLQVELERRAKESLLKGR